MSAKKSTEPKVQITELVRVARLSGDTRYDYWLNRKTAYEYYRKGQLALDLTNKCYCHLPGQELRATLPGAMTIRYAGN